MRVENIDLEDLKKVRKIPSLTKNLLDRINCI